MTASTLSTFAADVRTGLQRMPRQLPSKYFYDELGSHLFEAICRLPWYRVTRAELGLLSRHGHQMLTGLGSPVHLVELGCGSGEKLAAVAAPLAGTLGSVQLVDISPAALTMTRERLLREGVAVAHAHLASYEDGLALAARRRPAEGPLVVLFLGSNIGNFDLDEAARLLGHIRQMLRPGDALLLGTDLVKPEADLIQAYDDPLQVTAAFNRNLLRRINDELGGTFVLDGFAHRALWNATEQRVEMHLVSLRAQRVTVAGAGLDVQFEAGETIWTESSYKYDPDGVRRLGAAAGFDRADQWIDGDAQFALTRFQFSP